VGGLRISLFVAKPCRYWKAREQSVHMNRRRRTRPSVLIIALLIDLLLGEPPNRFHPVAWMGSAIAAARRQAPGNRGDQVSPRGRLISLAYGALIGLGGTFGVYRLGRLAEDLIDRLPPALRWATEAALLKTTFSVRRLAHAAREIQSALDRDDLPEARRLTSWHLVSRETSSLTQSQVAAAAIQSVAESTSDGIMAPLVSYFCAGLPGAFAYRFANTADSMLGYRDEAREWLGKVPARWDDLLNLLPARLTALLLIIGAAVSGEDAGQAWRVWRRDRRKTASPNAGRPMSAMAGALGVELEKADHYTLGGGGSAPRAADISRAVRVMGTSVALGLGLILGVSILQSRVQRDCARATPGKTQE